MAKPRVVVQVGHDPPLEPGHTAETGAGGELELVRAIGLALEDRLRRDGRFIVKRIPGEFPDDVKNGAFRIDAFIALHADAAGPTATGYTFGFPPGSEPSKQFADLVSARFSTFHPSSRRRDNLNKNLSEYYGWSRMPTQAPRILVEHGFLTNPDERTWLSGHVQQLAEAEYDAITELLGLDAQRHLSAAFGDDTGWPWFADWALWQTGRGRFAPYGRANRSVRPASAPARIPKPAFEVLRELTLGDGDVVIDVDLPVSGSSPMLTAPRAAQAVIERYVLRRRHDPHTDDDARTVVKHYVQIAGRAGLDPLLPVAQMVLETDNLRSKWARTHKNLAGIGVTSDDADPAKVPRWTSWQGAVIGHVGRVLAYVIPKGAENDVQRRLIEAALAKRPLSDDHRGTAATLTGLSAWAGAPNYVDAISRVANDIRKA